MKLIVKNTAFVIPAAPDGTTICIAYLINPTMQMVLRARQIIEAEVKKLPCITGRYPTLIWTNREIWGRSSIKLEGPIDYFRRHLHAMLEAEFPGHPLWMETHVNVRGNYDLFLYPSFNPKQVIERYIDPQ
jgi:Ni,Fe-hydrogenase III component G